MEPESGWLEARVLEELGPKEFILLLEKKKHTNGKFYKIKEAMSHSSQN